MEKPTKRAQGCSGEDAAVRFLEERGFSILERNFTFSTKGEIDIIAKKSNLVLLVEVKKRNSEAYGGPLYSITNKKKNTLRMVAKVFLLRNPALCSTDISFRFDLIAIQGENIEWIQDIIR